MVFKTKLLFKEMRDSIPKHFHLRVFLPNTFSVLTK
jgi:hypothetical protein